jgi:asparagine N-glycosylation enzyme membrane subunit Stt3
MEVSLIISIIIIVSIIVTLILNNIFKEKRYIKYIPVVIMVPFILYNFITMYSAPSEGFEALGRFVMGLLLLSAGIPSLICSIILDIFHNKKIKNN